MKCSAATRAPTCAGGGRVFRRRKRAAIMDAGVTIELPETVSDRSRSHRRRGHAHQPGVQLLGKTRIGADCTIRTGSVLAIPRSRQRAVKPYSMINASHLSRGTQVGPFAHLRQRRTHEENARAGNFVEVKKSVLGEGV